MIPSVEFLWIAAAVFLGSVPAFILAAWQRRGPRYLNQVSALEQSIETEGIEDVSDIYRQEVLPLQVKAHPDLVAKLRATARALAGAGAEITSDEIHARCPIPPNVDPRVMGAAFHPKEDWERIGWRPSKRRESHHRPVAIWRLRKAKVA